MNLTAAAAGIGAGAVAMAGLTAMTAKVGFGPSIVPASSAYMWGWDKLGGGGNENAGGIGGTFLALCALGVTSAIGGTAALAVDQAVKLAGGKASSPALWGVFLGTMALGTAADIWHSSQQRN